MLMLKRAFSWCFLVLSCSFCLILSAMFLTGCSDKSEPVDPNKLKTYLAEYEADYIKDSGKLDEDSVADYLKELSIDVMRVRSYQVADVSTFDDTLKFVFTDGTEYLYTPEGFDPYDFDAQDSESGSTNDAANQTSNQTETSGNVTDIMIDSDIPYPKASSSEPSESDVIGGSSIEVHNDALDKDASKYDDLGEDIDPNDYSDEELQELRSRIAEQSAVDDEDTEDDSDNKEPEVVKRD